MKCYYDYLCVCLCVCCVFVCCVCVLGEIVEKLQTIALLNVWCLVPSQNVWKRVFKMDIFNLGILLKLTKPKS